MSTPVVEILTIGREILDGRVIDTNSIWLAERLKQNGLVPRYAQRVDDEISRVIEAFTIASRRSQIVLLTGGLGPTADDLTAEAFAQFLREPLELNPEALAQVEAVFAKIGRKMIDQQKKQAMLPRSCEIMSNSEGTAPGFMRKGWYFMPGVPKEMKAMFDAHVFPRLPKIEGYRTSTWATQFTSEGELQSKLSSVHQALPPEFEITYRTRFPENHIGLHGDCATSEKKRVYESLASQIGEILGETVFSGGTGLELQSLESAVVDRLTKARRTLGTVESCTGGLVSHRITEVSGSSQVFWSAWVTYDNRAKEALGVAPHLIRDHGAVSSEVAQALAEAGLAQLKKLGAPAPICVATTGIAGPNGGTAEKPVGLCYIAVAQDGLPTQIEEVRGRAYLKRGEYKLLFSQKALDLVRRTL
jgi:nicotinamide-nucleotide amidase